MQRSMQASFLISLVFLLFMSGFPAVHASEVVQDDRIIWQSNSEEVSLLYYGDAGLFWEDEGEEDTIYRFDGAEVEEIHDLTDYQLGKVEQDGISVWSESRSDYWLGDFELYAEIGGEKKSLERYMDAPAENIRIHYPYVSWESQCSRNNFCASITYNLETDEKSSNSRYDYDDIMDGGIYERSTRERLKWIRPFESFQSHDYEYSDWIVADDYLLWKEPSGVYLMEAGEDDVRYTRIADKTDEQSRLTQDQQLIGWNEDRDWKLYSLDENKSYEINLPTKDVKDHLLYERKWAVLLENDEGSQLRLYDANSLLERARLEGRGHNPVTIKPEYISGVMARVHHGSVEEVLASSEYTVWLKYAMYYQKNGEPDIYKLEGGWEQAAFLDEELYAISEALDLSDDDEDEFGWKRELYKIDLKTGKKKLLYALPEYESVGRLIASNGYLYWEMDHGGKIIRYSPEDGSTKEIRTGADYFVDWYAAGDEVVWVEEDDEQYFQKYQEGQTSARTLTQWSSESADTNGIIFDGKRVIWGVDYPKKKSSEIRMVELDKGKETVLYKGRDRPHRPNTSIQMRGDTVYFLIAEKKDRFRLTAYDIKKKRNIYYGNDVSAFTVNGDDLYYADRSPLSWTYYLLRQPIGAKYAVDVATKWVDLSKNDNRWNDIRFTFAPEDIQLLAGGKKYTWAQFYDNQEKWNAFLNKNKAKLSVQIKF